MSEEVKIKISQPMFEVGELEVFDNNIDSIVEEYSKMLFKEKDQILTQRIIMKQEEEIERLNNIINKAIEYIKLVATDHDIMNNNEIIYTQMQYEEIENLLDILQGSDKE